jgi:G3E family GTPase
MAQTATATPRNADPTELRRALDTVDFFAGLVEAAAINRQKSVARSVNIPVVIVSGFLGAGKTTLMHHLLTADHGMKIAAMVNDFAALNIDEALISDVSDDTTALANGCICCSLSGGVARSLAEIEARPEPVEAILVEASGVSDPAAIAQVANTVDGIALDCIVTVVDAADFQTDTTWRTLLVRQVAAANLVLLNKTDLVPAAALDATVAQRAVMAQNAQILRTINCAVPPAVVLENAIQPDVALNTAAHHSDHGFATVILEAHEPIDRASVEAVLKDLPDGIARLKGFLQLKDAPQTPLLLQCVGRRWTWHTAPEPSVKTGLVVIGKSDVLSDPNILEGFRRIGLNTQNTPA